MISLINKLLLSRTFSIVRRLQFVLALAIFVYAALMPSSQVPLFYKDHTLHFIGNFLLIMSAFVASFGRLKPWLLILCLIPFSAAIELSQWFTPTRQVDMRDFDANLMGLTTGFVVSWVIEISWNRINQATKRRSETRE